MRRSTLLVLVAVFLLGVLLGGAGISRLSRVSRLPAGVPETASRGASGTAPPPGAAARAFRSAGNAAADDRAQGALSELREIAARSDIQPWMGRWNRAVARLALAEIPEALELLEAPGLRYQRDGLEQAILSRWAELDPVGAIEYAMQGRRYLRDQAVLHIVYVWAQGDPEAALEWQRTLPPGVLSRSVLGAILPRLVTLDPPRAIGIASDEGLLRDRGIASGLIGSWAGVDPAGAAAALSAGGTSVYDNTWRDVAAAWARTDPDAALEWAGRVPANTARQAAMAGVVATIALEDPARAFQLAETSFTGQGRHMVLHQVMATLAESNLPAAVEQLGRMKSPADIEAAVQTIGWMWVSEDREGAMQRLDSLPPNARGYMTSMIANRWAEQDPAAAMEWARQLPASRDRDTAFQSVITIIAGADPDAALRYAQEVDGESARRNALSAVARQVATTDPLRALELCRDLPVSMRASVASSGVIYELARSDPAAAAAFIEELPSGVVHQNGLHYQLAEGSAAVDVEGAIAWARDLPEGELKRSAVTAVSDIWAGSDPRRALEYADSLAGPLREQVVSRAVAAWSRHEPDAAAEWAVSLADPAERGVVLGTVVEQWANVDPVQAATFVASLPAGESQDRAALNVVHAWARQDPGEALAWASDFTDPELRQQAMNSVVGAWTQQDPAAAASFLGEQPPGAARDALVLSAIESGAGSDPAGAAEWTALLSDDPGSLGAAWQQIAGAWAQHDHVSGAEWLATLPAGFVRDEAVQTYVHAVALQDPELALRTAVEVASDARRAELIEAAARLWMLRDRGAAEERLRAPDIPDDLRRRLLGE